MLLYNVEGIVSKLKDTSFVSFISCYDFVCMVETFVDTFTSTLFPSFTSFVSPAKKLSHHGRRSGGVIVLVRNVLMRFIKQIEVDYDNVIILEVSKELLSTDANVFVVSTYLNPPNSPFYIHAIMITVLQCWNSVCLVFWKRMKMLLLFYVAI